MHTAIWKTAVQGAQTVRRLNIEGDAQGDLAGHGGEHRAVMVYQMDSYRYWESQLGRNDFTFGQFGENFTVDGLSDDEVCIGDCYRIGGALFEVTQPRVTCYRVGIRMDEPRMPALLVSHHRPGFYLRVLEEGDVSAGDEITKVAEGPERMTVAEIDALLYLPVHPRDRLKRALLIPALSVGWRDSFQSLADQEVVVAGPSPAWPGFRPLRVARIDRECSDVISLSFESTDGSPLPAALPGQFLVLRLRPKPDIPPILRNYSLSGAPGAEAYRVSVKHEANGLGSTFLHQRIKPGDMLEVSAPRGSFTLQPGDGPVVLLSAGIGATPVLAMLHALASVDSSREVWWIYAARNRDHHPFAEETHSLLEAIPRSRSHIAYSRPGPEDSAERLDARVLDRLGVPLDGDFYLCGPTSFLATFTEALKARGVAAGSIHVEIFGPEESITPGILKAPKPVAHLPLGSPGPGPQVSFARSGLTVPWNPRFQSLLELAEACDVSVKWACRTGVCHTCECALIGGAVSYQPDPLEPPANGNILICCSQPQGDLEVDL